MSSKAGCKVAETDLPRSWLWLPAANCIGPISSGVACMQANHAIRHRCFACFHVSAQHLIRHQTENERETEKRSKERLMHIGSHAGESSWSELKWHCKNTLGPDENLLPKKYALWCSTHVAFLYCMPSSQPVDCSTLKSDHQQMGVCLAREYCSVG